MTHRFVAMESALRSRIEQHRFDRQLYLGRPDYAGPGPQIYVNTVDPGVELAAHFHKVDQFQVFLGTPGAMFKRHEIEPVMVHYTDAYSTYGPFRAAPDQPLRYATIRAESSNFGGVMPGARDELITRGRRSRSVAVKRVTAADAPGPGEWNCSDIITEEADGLATRVLRIGPRIDLSVPAQSRSAGRAYLVLDGAAVVFGETYGFFTIGWSSNDEPGLVVSGGPEGAIVLVMDFPDPPTNSAVRASQGETS